MRLYKYSINTIKTLHERINDFIRICLFMLIPNTILLGKTQNKHGEICRIYHTRHSKRRDNYLHLPDTDMLCLYAGFMDRY